MDGRVLFYVAFALFMVAVWITLTQMQVTTLSVIALGAFIAMLFEFIRTER